MIYGYAISGPDNGSTMYDEHDFGPLCENCGQYIGDQRTANLEIVISRQNFDFSYTYDGWCIVSQNFRDFCLRNSYSGLRFGALPLSPGFYSFAIYREVTFDSDRRKTRFLNKCPLCGNYDSIVGAFPVFLEDVDRALEDGFFRTDLVFGSGNQKAPVYLVGCTTKTKLDLEKFSGLEVSVIDQ